MDRKTVDNIIEWATAFYMEIFSPFADHGRRGLATELSDIPDNVLASEVGKEIEEMIKQEPDRPKNFSIGDMSIMYIPNGEYLDPIFEETWHSVSPLESGKDDETFSVVAIYLAIRKAIREDKTDFGRPKEIIERSIEGEYVNSKFNVETIDKEKYKYRNAAVGLLEYFEKGNEGDPIPLERASEISREILRDIVDGEDADRAIAKWEKKLVT